jgi:hypothetical protein
MEFKRLILSSLIMLAFFAANVHAIQDAGSVSLGQGQSLADKLIEESNTGSVYKNNDGFAPTPQAQRELEKNKSTLDWTMPSTLTGGGSSAKSSRTQAEASSDGTAADSTAAESAPAANTSAATDTELPPAQTQVITVGGNWYFTMNDSVERDLVLTLFQKGNEVFGAGKIKEDNNTQDVTASGAVADATLELNLVSANPIVQYKLNLNLSEDWAQGVYQASTTGGDSWTGSAEGEKTA